MGEIADSMINGQFCHYCGVYLEPEETVYLVHSDKKNEKVKMPKEGEFGVPVVCESCKN